MKRKNALQGRVLARVVAEDLRNVRAGDETAGATTTETVARPPEWPRPDITNVGGDGTRKHTRLLSECTLVSSFSPSRGTCMRMQLP